jgi:hypothetical protein
MMSKVFLQAFLVSLKVSTWLLVIFMMYMGTRVSGSVQIIFYEEILWNCEIEGFALKPPA